MLLAHIALTTHHDTHPTRADLLREMVVCWHDDERPFGVDAGDARADVADLAAEERGRFLAGGPLPAEVARLSALLDRATADAAGPAREAARADDEASAAVLAGEDPGPAERRAAKARERAAALAERVRTLTAAKASAVAALAAGLREHMEAWRLATTEDYERRAATIAERLAGMRAELVEVFRLRERAALLERLDRVFAGRPGVPHAPTHAGPDASLALALAGLAPAGTATPPPADDPERADFVASITGR